MNKMFNGTERLQLFGLEIIALISQGKSETIEQIEQHIDAGNLIQYIREKNKDNMFNTFDNDAHIIWRIGIKRLQDIVNIYREMREASLVFIMIMKDYY